MTPCAQTFLETWQDPSITLTNPMTSSSDVSSGSQVLLRQVALPTAAFSVVVVYKTKEQGAKKQRDLQSSLYR